MRPLRSGARRLFAPLLELACLVCLPTNKKCRPATSPCSRTYCPNRMSGMSRPHARLRVGRARTKVWACITTCCRGSRGVSSSDRSCVLGIEKSGGLGRTSEGSANLDDLRTGHRACEQHADRRAAGSGPDALLAQLRRMTTCVQCLRRHRCCIVGTASRRAVHVATRYFMCLASIRCYIAQLGHVVFAGFRVCAMTQSRPRKHR